MRVRFENAGVDDAELVAGLIRACFARQAELLRISEVDYPRYVAFTRAEDVVRRLEAGNHVTVARLGDVPRGTVTARRMWADPSRGEIRSLGVLPAYRGRGLGDALVRRAESQLVAEGVGIVELRHVAEFSGLRRYYERLGYSVVGTRPLESFPFDETVLERSVESVGL